MLQGRYAFETIDSALHEGQARDAPTTAGSDRGKGPNTSGKPEMSPYKPLNCGIYFKIVLDAPLVEKSNVMLV